MNKAIIFIIFILVILYGCTTTSKAITFAQGVERINVMDEKYGSTTKAPPNSTENINALYTQITGFSALNKDMPKSLKYLVDFRLKILEAEKLHIEGWQWGKGSTTDYGFGCNKGYPRITESARLRNASAQKGYEAVNILQSFIDEFPEEAKSVNLTQKDVLFLNAAYYQIEEKSGRDARIIKNACKNNETLQ